MPHSGWFTGTELGPEWKGQTFQQLAGICEQAHLTNREARTLNLYCRGHSIRGIGEVLGVKREKSQVIIWRHLHGAVNKIVRTMPERRPGRRDEIWEMLDCMRNSHGHDHGPGIGERSTGGLREMTAPTMVRPEDLMHTDELEAEVGGVLERIARANRNYGVGLVISQKP